MAEVCVGAPGRAGAVPGWPVSRDAQRSWGRPRTAPPPPASGLPACSCGVRRGRQCCLKPGREQFSPGTERSRVRWAWVAGRAAPLVEGPLTRRRGALRRTRARAGSVDARRPAGASRLRCCGLSSSAAGWRVGANPTWGGLPWAAPRRPPRCPGTAAGSPLCGLAGRCPATATRASCDEWQAQGTPPPPPAHGP